jgi:hypothetical protein
VIKAVKKRKPTVKRKWSWVSVKKRPRHTLDDLIAQCDVTAPPDKDKKWVTDKAVGRELI